MCRDTFQHLLDLYTHVSGGNIGHYTTLVQMEIPQQLLEGLLRRFSQIFGGPLEMNCKYGDNIIWHFSWCLLNTQINCYDNL